MLVSDRDECRSHGADLYRADVQIEMEIFHGGQMHC